MTDEIRASLGAATRDQRLANLRLQVASNAQSIMTAPLTDEVNNHVHTTYSFSPYTPTQAAWMARSAGLRAVGSVDHDSIAAAEETLEASRILKMGSTVGFEVRVSFAGTPFSDRRLNNPDSIGIGYIVVHGVPRPRIPDVAEFLAPIQQERNKRNRLQVDAMNVLLSDLSAPVVSYEQVRANSMVDDGGSITERHILFTAARGLMEWLGVGEELRRWIESRIAGPLPEKVRGYLDDPANPHYVYDVIGVLKSGFIDRFFIQPSPEECIPVGKVVAFANEINAIPAYAYLGDVADSPTGDKRAEKYEDDFLDELIPALTDLGFRAVTYMPPRNTRDQLRRVRELCARNGLMEISGVDINSSRQEFTCPEINHPEFRHLIDATWALIAHEKLTSVDPGRSLFADTATPLPQRIERYARIGRALDPAHPEDIGSIVD